MRNLTATLWILGAWICLIQTSPEARDAEEASLTPARETLRHHAVELVEDLVQRERFYHRRTGTYTPILARLEFEIPEELRPFLQVQVVEAARDRLLVRAYMDVALPDEKEGLPQSDQLWSNEMFQMQASFPLAGRRLATLTTDAPLPEITIEQVQESASLGTPSVNSSR
jgi:hypothetical protein